MSSTAKPGFVHARRWLGGVGGVYAAAGVALSAYASHGAQAAARESLWIASVMLFVHGVALAALAPLAVRRMAWMSLSGLAFGALLFSGSLAMHVLAGMPTTLAPMGGSVMILAWLVFAVDAWRR